VLAWARSDLRASPGRMARAGHNSRTSWAVDTIQNRKSTAPPGLWVTCRAGQPQSRWLINSMSRRTGCRQGPCQHPVGVIGRSVGEVAVALATVAGRQPGEGGVTAATGDTHRSSPTQSTNRPGHVRTRETLRARLGGTVRPVERRTPPRRYEGIGRTRRPTWLFVDSIAHFVIGGACPALPPCTWGTRRPPAPC
jgi:hypothetical protein